MVKNFIRALLIVILIFVVLVDFDLPIIISTPINQLFIAIIILFLILTVDEIIGFLTGLIFLIIYFKYYQRKLNKSSKTSENSQPSNNLIGVSPSSKSHFVSSPAMYSTSSPNEESTLSSILNFFSGNDSKPKPYSTQPEIPEHYIQDMKNDNSTLIPYVSTELLKAAQNNIYSEENYNSEIKQDANFYGIQGLNSDNIHYGAFDSTMKTYTTL
jgi:hypothetical protein